MTTNPYAAPTSKLIEPSNSDALITFNGKHVIVKNETALPNHCVKCGKIGHKKQKRTLRWINPWWYLTIIISLLITIIASIFVTKRLKITYYLCESHLKKRTKKRVMIWSSLILIIGAFIISAYMSDLNQLSEGATLAIILTLSTLLIIWLIVALVTQGDFNIKKAVKIMPVEGKKQYLFHLKGISEDFLKAINIL